jgi:hypothetical protein
MKKISSLVMLVFFLMISGNASAEDYWWECGWKNVACLARFLLPNNPNGTNQVIDTPKVHEWAASEGHLYGRRNVIKMRVRFDDESLRTLNQTSLGGQPFALEIDVSEANNGTRLKFDYVKHSFLDQARAIQDTSASDSINPNKNAMGLLVRDTRAIKAGKDYYIYFYLKYEIPAEGVAVVPSLQISYNVHYVEMAANLLSPNPAPMFPQASPPFDSPWNFFPMESENYGDVSNNDAVSWMVYPSSIDGKSNLVPGMSWNGKSKGDAKKNFMLALNSNVESEVLDTAQVMRGKRLDYLDKVCRQVNPNPIVEQFRNAMTGNITIYKTPSNALGQRYANANCDVGAFALPSYLDGDGSGSGATSGTAKASKPNIVATDTFVTIGEGDGTPKVTAQRAYLDTPLWCQMRMKNASSVSFSTTFSSACYISIGKKFDGWSDAVSAGKETTKGLKKNETHTEHERISNIFYPNWYNAVSKLDVDDRVAETNEKDNSYNKDSPFAFQIWGRPNVVASVSADKASYTLSETISATASFANTGKHPYGKTGYVDWYVDGGLLSEQDRIQREKLHPGVSGKTEIVSFPAPQSYGVHEIKACFRYAVDDLVEEAEPADNCSVNTFSIPDPTPQVVIVAPLPPPPPTGTTGGGTSVYTPTNLPLITSCPQTPDPDFSVYPAIQSGDFGTVIFGNNKQRLILPASTLAQAKTSFVWGGFAGFDPSLVTRICFNSADTNWGVVASTACANTFTLQGTNWIVDIPNTPQASKGTWSFKQGTTEYWVNPSTITTLENDTDGHIRYNGWTPNTVTVVDDVSGMMLNVAFSSQKTSGFWIPSNTVLNGKVFWNNDQDNYPGMPGQLSCDANGKLIASIPNVAPASTGRILLGLTDATQFGWQTTNQWILPAGAFIVNANGDYKLPLSASPFQKREVTYDKGQQKLTLTINSDSRMLTSFNGITNISQITKDAYFDAWIVPTGQVSKLIQGTVARSQIGIWTIVFTGLPPEFGGNAYLTLTNGTKSWQSVATFAFGSGILVDVTAGDYVMSK